MTTMDQSQPHNATADGLPPVDQPIDNSVEINPTAEEAARALNELNAGDAGASKESTDKAPAYVDPRTEIANRLNESRRAAGAPQDLNQMAAEFGTDVVTSASQQQQQPQDDAFRLKVDGVERVITRDQAAAILQKNLAADARLAEATRLLNEAKASQVQPVATTANSGENRSVEPSPSTSNQGSPSIPKGTRIDRETLAMAVEKLQLGSTDEGVAALEQVLERVAPQTAPVDFQAEVEVVLNARTINQESTEATTAFLRKYPDLEKDNVLQTVSAELFAGEMVKDFLNAGVTKEQIASMVPTRQALLQMHTAMRVKDPSFGRPMRELVAVVEKDPRFQRNVSGVNAPVTVDVNRQSRKEAVPQQPALRTPPAVPNAGQQQPPNINQSRSNAVQRMIAARGNRVTA